MSQWEVVQGDSLAVLKTMDAGTVNTCVTSPPYFGLRDYGVEGQIGLEPTPDEYVRKMVEVFSEVRRVLREDGTLWLNLGDSYAAGSNNKPNTGILKTQAHYQDGMVRNITRPIPDGYKAKDLLGIPWRVAFALQADGWYLRQDIIWNKPNPMPESVRDRCTKAHEYIFLLAKSERYHFDSDAMKEAAITAGKIGGFTPRAAIAAGKTPSGNMCAEKGCNYVRKETRNRRSVWSVATRPYKGAHFATYPPDLIRPCVLAGCPVGGLVLDPFNGSGTTGAVAVENGRRYLGIELNAEYIKLAHERIGKAESGCATIMQGK